MKSLGAPSKLLLSLLSLESLASLVSAFLAAPRQKPLTRFAAVR
jgi:hypothetical protein